MNVVSLTWCHFLCVNAVGFDNTEPCESMFTEHVRKTDSQARSSPFSSSLMAISLEEQEMR